MIEEYDPLQSQALQLTNAAVERLHALYGQHGGEKFRVYITGGGCSGFQYGFKFDPQQLEDDLEVTQGDVAVLVDALSIQYIEGSQIDYQQSLMGEQFVVHNPNATTTCSCGSSFAI